MHRSLLMAATLSVATLGSAAHAATLYTTQADFAQWVNTTPILTAALPTSLDTNSTNGVGNTLAAGAAGTAGSLSASEVAANNFTYFYGPGEASNTGFLSALGVTKTGTAINGSTGTITFIYTPPTAAVAPSGAYFQLGVVLNYSGNFFQQQGGTTTANGDGSFTRTLPFTINPVANLGYFNLGIIYNTNYGLTSVPTIIDSIQGTGAATPEPTTLVAALAGSAVSAIRRRRA